VTLDARQSEHERGGSEVLRLRKERERLVWSLTELTRRTGIAANDLSMLERGLRPPFPSWRRRIAQALGVSEEKLFTSDEPPDTAA
jgi:transcriptional regulator with XRE-family HTH domain